MAGERGAPHGGVRARLEEAVAVLNELEEAVAVLNELGGLAELEDHEGGVIVGGYGCPLAAVTLEHPEPCRMVEAFIAELAGVPARERCERGVKPRCCFEVNLAESCQGSSCEV